MTNSGFGEHLRREREMRGVSLDEIAAATRISTRFLEALETETWGNLPGGVFNRGFVRTVARYLGLEEESLLAEYSMATRLPGVTPVPSVISSKPARPAAMQTSSQRRIPWPALAAVAVVLALGVGGWFGWKQISARRAEWNAAAAALPADPAPPSAPRELWADPADPADQAADAAQQQTSPWASPSHDLELRIDATKATSLIVTSDGAQTFTGAIAAGESRTASAKTALVVEAQDAGAIRLELNGQALAPIGQPGQPGKITLGSPSPVPGAGGHD